MFASENRGGSIKQTLQAASGEAGASYRVCPQNLQVWLSGLQQLGHHVQEALHEGFDALGVAGHQQLVQSLHGDHNVPANSSESAGKREPVGFPSPSVSVRFLKSHSAEKLLTRSDVAPHPCSACRPGTRQSCPASPVLRRRRRSASPCRTYWGHPGRSTEPEETGWFCRNVKRSC